MEKSLNVNAIDTYSHDLAAKLVQKYFAQKDSISGKEIVSFSSIKQINFLIIKILFEKWQGSIEQSKTPFFDYEHPDVQKALGTYANVLSQHIVIGEQFFRPLVHQACQEMLLLLLNPYEYHIHEIGKLRQSSIELNTLKNLLKYLHINRFLMQELIDDAASQGNSVALSELITSFRLIYQMNKDRLEDVEQHLEILNRLHPCTLEMFLSEENLPDMNPYQDNEKPLIPIPEAEEIPVQEPAIVPQSNGNASKIQYEEEEEKANLNANTLNDRFKKEESTLNERFKENQKIDNLRSYISVNERFLFISELFKGNHTAFNMCINELEQCSNLKEAEQLLQNDYISRYQWDIGQGQAAVLISLVKRRF